MQVDRSSSVWVTGSLAQYNQSALSHQIGPTDSIDRIYVECMTDEMLEYSAFVYAGRVKEVCSDDFVYVYATLRCRISQRGRYPLHASPRPCRPVVEEEKYLPVGFSFGSISRITPSSSIAAENFRAWMTNRLHDRSRQSSRRGVWPLTPPYHNTACSTVRMCHPSAKACGLLSLTAIQCILHGEVCIEMKDRQGSTGPLNIATAVCVPGLLVTPKMVGGGNHPITCTLAARQKAYWR
ncbi:hypothetical protein U1Q18_044724 [Sarracenia purpurea var. burkii]